MENANAYRTERYNKGCDDIAKLIDENISEGWSIYSIFELPGLTYITYVI